MWHASAKAYSVIEENNKYSLNNNKIPNVYATFTVELTVPTELQFISDGVYTDKGFMASHSYLDDCQQRNALAFLTTNC